MHFRIGLNMGDVIVEGENLYGEGVNVASRIQPLANPGGISISGAVNDTISNHTLGTGPMFVFDMWKKYSKINNDISVSKGKWFHPPTTNKQQQIGYLKKNGYYGMHICTGIWRNNMLGIKEFNDTFFGTCLIIIFKTLHRLKSGFFHSLCFIKDIITKFTSSYSHLFCYFANNINITFHC